MIISWGYYYILGVFSAFVYFALRLARSRPGVLAGLDPQARAPAGAAILGGAPLRGLVATPSSTRSSSTSS